MNQKLKDLIKQNQAEAAMLRPKRRNRKLFDANRFGPLIFLLIFTAGGAAFVHQSNAAPATSPTVGEAEMYITPAAQQLKAQSQLVATIWANSYSKPVNAVQAVVTYPADKLRYVESDASSSQFTIQVAADSTPGKLVLSRSSAQPLTGNQLVAGVVFEPISSAGSADVRVDSSSQLMGSDDNQNILGRLSGGNYMLKL